MNHPVKKENMKALADYQSLLMKEPKLRYLFFELTDKCNLNCRHCGSKCTGKNSRFLEYEVIEKTLQRVAECYNASDIMICITGGEPLLHPAVFDVIRKAHELGFPSGMTTNGTLITHAAARRLAVSGLDTVGVSIDGLGEIHDRFRGVPGSFSQAMRGIQALEETGLYPQVITVIHRENYFQLEEMYDLFRKIGIYSWRIINVDPIGRAGQDRSMLLNASELSSLLEFIRSKRFDNDNEMEVTYGCSHFVTYDYEREVRDYYFQCIAGTRIGSIMADGSIGACLDIERREDLLQGNIYKDDFIDVWEGKFDRFRSNRALKCQKCRECRHGEVCLGDSAHTWDYDKDEPMYCVAEMLEADQL